MPSTKIHRKCVLMAPGATFSYVLGYTRGFFAIVSAGSLGLHTVKYSKVLLFIPTEPPWGTCVLE